MDVPSVVASALSFNQATFVDKALHGLTDEDLVKRPNDHANPIGWLIWHQTRVEDAWISRLSDQSQLWIEGKWHEKFGMEPNPREHGGGHTLEQVMALRPTVENLKGYATAVRERTLDTLQAFTSEDLEREVPGPGGTRKIGEMLGILLVDHFHHSGQVCYLRGTVTPGWSPWP